MDTLQFHIVKDVYNKYIIFTFIVIYPLSSITAKRIDICVEKY